MLVLGGSQGARSLNETVPEALAKAVTPVRVLHQCGERWLADVRERYRALGGEAQSQVVPFIEDVPAALAAAHLVIARAGASTVSEICAVGRPSLLVPFPFAAGDHQRRNAEALAAAGAGLCIEHEAATPARIAGEIDRLAKTPAALGAMAQTARALGKPHAAVDIASDLLALAGLRSEGVRTSSESASDEPSPESARLAGLSEAL